jgi:DNA polymerase-3 subunit delta
MSLALLKEHIKTGEFAPAYVFWGSEDYLLSHYLGLIASKYVKADFAHFNHRVFEGKSLDIAQLQDAALAYPVFDERKLIVVDNLLPPAFNAELGRQIAPLVPDMPRGNILLFRYDPEVDFEKKNAALKNFFQKINAVTVRFEPPTQKELSAWAARHFAAQGKEVLPSDLSYLLSVCDNTMSALKNEIEKICRYCTLDRVERRHIDAVAVKSTEARVFELTDAVAERRCAPSLRLLNELLLDKTDHVYLLGAIASTFSSLFKIKLCRKSGAPQGEIARRAGVRPSLLGRYLRLADGFSEKQLSFALTACRDSDIALKSSRMDKDTILELLVVTLATNEAKTGGHP